MNLHSSRFDTDYLLCSITDDDYYIPLSEYSFLKMVKESNYDDLFIVTSLFISSLRFVFKNRVAVFSVPVLNDERILAIAEVRDDSKDDIAFKWMNTVVSAVETIHGISLYGVMLVTSNSLPKIRGSIYIPEAKTRYLDGTLKLEHILMCPHQCITNIPVLRRHPESLGPAFTIGGLMRSVKLAQMQGTPVTPNREIGNNYKGMGEILEWRGTKYGDLPLYSTSDVKGKVSLSYTGRSLLKKSERVAAYLSEKGKLISGNIIALLLPPGLDLIAGFYGSLLLGLIPVVIRNVTSQNYNSLVPTISHILERSKSVAILTSHSTIRQLRSKEVSTYFELRTWPPLLDIEDIGRKRLEKMYHPPTSELIAYIDYTVSDTGVLTGTKVSHQNCLHFCRSHQQTCELNPNHSSVLILEPSSGLGLMIYLLSSVFSGQHTILIHPTDLLQNPSLWFFVLSQHKAIETYCTYSVIETCLRDLSSATQNLISKGINLSNLQSLVVVGEERPRMNIISPFSVLFARLGLSFRAISTSFGCRVNSAICVQGLKQPTPIQLYLDARALKLDKIKVVERGVPHSILLSSSGRLLPGVTVVIVNSNTRTLLGEGELGEIWVISEHNAVGFDGIGDDISAEIHKEHFQASIQGSDTILQQYARSGFLGFIIKGEEEEEGQIVYHLFIVGSIEGSLNLDSARYYPRDLENSVNRCHKFITTSAVFEGDHLLVVVAELESEDKDPLSVVPRITTALVEEHYVIPGVVVIVDPKTIPINSRGEIQRLHLKDSFLSDQLDPIYIAYNL
ncbi:Disco-interacting protein 2 A [Oopsacas minuta]|uniref:Disco-interacting protein 2 A n=1 Tax=Oopsacas minuta TaxID=111878 RepID=A0AAV7JFC8_9METZ|nr:Disco-interacting protein 2 A [Oopsacas minuta]